MNIKNETCIQRVLILFYYQGCMGLKDIQPDSIRQWKTFLENRLEGIAQMMEILLKVHDDWAITARKEHIQMETQTLDFNHIKLVLSDHGFKTDDYVIKLDYTRKWGVL